MGAVMKTSYCFFAGAVGSSRCQCGRRCGIKFRIAPLRSRGLIVYKELDNSHESSIKPRHLQVPTSSGTIITRLDHINPTSHPDEKAPSPPRSISKMKPFLPFFAALVATVVADTMEITYICGGGFSCAGLATWHSDYGTYHWESHDGCQNPPVPAMQWLCIDNAQSRASFKFNCQNQRCLRRTTVSGTYTNWTPTPCTW